MFSFTIYNLYIHNKGNKTKFNIYSIFMEEFVTKQYCKVYKLYERNMSSRKTALRKLYNFTTTLRDISAIIPCLARVITRTIIYSLPLRAVVLPI